MAAPSMAAALAASLPAPQAAPTPAAPTYEAIPASMSKAIDIEAEIPLTCVQLDGLVRFEDRFTSFCPVARL
jgi:translation initiation factor 3 subunit H